MSSKKSKYKTIIILILILSFCSNSSSIAATDLKIADNRCTNLNINKIISEISNRYNVEGFEVDFYQTTRSNIVDMTTTARGKLSVLKQEKMRLEYYEPYPQTIICNNKNIWFFNPLDNQVIVTDKQSFGKKNGDMLCLLSVSEIQKKFLVSLERGPQYNCDVYKLILLPKTPSLALEKAEIHVAKEKFIIVRIIITTSYGDKTIIKFKNLNLDLIPHENIFKLDLTKSTDVIHLNK